jgi:hypothetical protein
MSGLLENPEVCYHAWYLSVSTYICTLKYNLPQILIEFLRTSNPGVSKEGIKNVEYKSSAEARIQERAFS